MKFGDKIQTAWLCLGLLGELIRLINNAIENQRSTGVKLGPDPAGFRLGELDKWPKIADYIDRKAAKI